LDALEAWLREGDDLLNFRFDAKARLIQVGDYAGKDLRDALDTFIEGEYACSFWDHITGEQLENLSKPQNMRSMLTVPKARSVDEVELLPARSNVRCVVSIT
jgi:hypothetical protein